MSGTKKKILVIGALFILFWVIVLCAALKLTGKSGAEAVPSAQPDIPAVPAETVEVPPPSPAPIATPEPTPEPAEALPAETSYAYYPSAVDLRWYLPEAQFELLFTTEENVTGRGLYPPVPLLEEQTAKMLKNASTRFLEDGYIIRIYDAYRPLSAQQALWEAVRDKKFIADPALGGSWHQRGRAVDMSLVNAETGEELEMPTPMHTFSDEAGRYANNNWSSRAKENVDYMTQVMRAAGFSTLRTEWWHFENNYQGGVYLPDEIDYSALEYFTGSPPAP